MPDELLGRKEPMRPGIKGPELIFARKIAATREQDVCRFDLISDLFSLEDFTQATGIQETDDGLYIYRRSDSRTVERIQDS